MQAPDPVLVALFKSMLHKSDRQRQISYDIACKWSLKKRVQMNLSTKQK